MSVMGFDNADDMFAYMREQEEAANARVTPGQAQIGYGAWWLRPYEDVVIFGYVPTQDEVRASEGGDEADPEELQYTLETLADAHRRGYRYGRAYSVIEPEGEWGSTHISTMVEITEEQFNQAQAHGWDGHEIAAQADGHWILKALMRSAHKR